MRRLGALLLLGTLPAPAAPSGSAPPPSPPFNASRFPHFHWRARVVSTSSGPVPPTTSFAFYVTAGQDTQANGSGWSNPVLFDNASVVKWLGAYPNVYLLDSPWGNGYDPHAGITDFPAVVTHFTVSQAPGLDYGTNTTTVEIEVTPAGVDAGAPTRTLRATLLGVKAEGSVPIAKMDLGIMVGRDSSGAPAIETMRSFNRRHYWGALDNLPQIQSPQKIVLGDSLSGDDDKGMWDEGVAAMRALGLGQLQTGGNYYGGSVVNYTRPLIKNLTGRQMVAGGSCLGAAGKGKNSWTDGNVV